MRMESDLKRSVRSIMELRSQLDPKIKIEPDYCTPSGQLIDFLDVRPGRKPKVNLCMEEATLDKQHIDKAQRCLLEIGAAGVEIFIPLRTIVTDAAREVLSEQVHIRLV